LTAADPSDAEGHDAQLAARAGGGEERAFTLLMRRHKEAVYRFTRRYAGDADEAYDLTQETFAAAWLAIGRYDPTRPFGVWLRRIALNKCRDWSRRRAVRRWLTRSDPIDGPSGRGISDTALDPEAGLAERQALARLDRAIADLPANLKEPLLLTAIEGLSQEEAGALLGLSAKAVETRVYRARRRLAEKAVAMAEG
jgi:RNA polymerase sigma-70 factor (ECF subfamily)